MKIRFTGLLVLMSLFLLSACGQKGPLYLERTAAPKAAASVTEKEADSNVLDAESKPESTETSTETSTDSKTK